MLDFGRELCSNPHFSVEREWLVTNGLGGYAAGTIAGVLTRRYHGLLVAALQPPVGRSLLLAKLDEVVTCNGLRYPLFTNRWHDGELEPEGYVHLERFRLEGTTPVWTFACADALLEKRVWMEPGANTTYVRYDLCRGSEPLALRIKAIANHRDHHGRTQAGGTPDVRRASGAWPADHDGRSRTLLCAQRRGRGHATARVVHGLLPEHRGLPGAGS